MIQVSIKHLHIKFIPLTETLHDPYSRRAVYPITQRKIERYHRYEECR